MTNISRKLQALSKEILIELVADLSDRYDDIDQIIESYLEGNEDAAQDSSAPGAKQLHLVKTIEKLATTNAYYHYYESHLFTDPLERLLQDISRLAEADLEQALGVLDYLLERHEGFFECVDDSGGEISELMYDAVQLWMEVAARLRINKPQARNWLANVMSYYARDSEYGCFDGLFDGCGELLTDEELYKLASQFESEAQAVKEMQSDCDHGLRLYQASHGLRGVATALQHLTLYERSFLLERSELDVQQLEEIIRFALRVKDYKRASYWLQQPQFKKDEYCHSYLTNILLKQQGNIEQLKANLLAEWQKYPTSQSLQAYWQYAEPYEQEKVVVELVARVEQLDDKNDVVNMLLLVGQYQTAAHYLIEQRTSFRRAYYSTVLNWKAVFEEEDQTLAVIVCYRLLLLDILERGFSRGYHHAVRYFNALLALDEACSDYCGLENAEEFIAKLQSKHGRKWLFWKEANYPAK